MHMTMIRIPANRCRLSRHRDTMESDTVQRQERQIVQSWLNLDDFLPGITPPVLCRGSLSAHGPVRAPPPAHGRLGGVPGRQESRPGGRTGSLIRRARSVGGRVRQALKSGGAKAGSEHLTVQEPAYPLGPPFAGPRQGLARVAPPPSIPWTPALRQAMARTRPAGRAHRRQPQPPRGSFGLGRAPTPTSLGRLAEPPSW